MDTLDVTTALKTLPFLKDKDIFSHGIAIVFDPASKASRADAEAMKSYIDNDGGMVLGTAKVTTKLVSTADTAGLSGAKIIFLANEISSEGINGICNAAAKAGMLTISTDIECVKAHKCVLGISTKGRVTIYYSEDAATSARVTFDKTFLILVNRV